LQIGNRRVLLFSVAMRHVVPSALMRCVRSPPPSCVERRGKERGNGAWVIHGLRFRAVLRASLFPGPPVAPRPHTAPFCQKRRPEKAREAARSSTAPSSGSLPIALWARGNHHKPAPRPHRRRVVRRGGRRRGVFKAPRVYFLLLLGFPWDLTQTKPHVLGLV
jgi:hypothetical protein